MTDRFAPVTRFMRIGFPVLAVGLVAAGAHGAESGRLSPRSVVPGSVKECKNVSVCRIDVPVVRTPLKPDPCEIQGMVETVNVWAPMVVVWDIQQATSDPNDYRFSAGRGIRFVQQNSGDPLPTDKDFDDPDYDDSPSFPFINKRGYRWSSVHDRVGIEFHYQINLLVRQGIKWVKCSAADPKIVNTN